MDGRERGRGRRKRAEDSKPTHVSVSIALITHLGGIEFYICNFFHESMSYCSTLNISF